MVPACTGTVPRGHVHGSEILQLFLFGSTQFGPFRAERKSVDPGIVFRDLKNPYLESGPTS